MTNQPTNQPDTRNGKTFRAWYNQCDQLIATICGLSLDDLADGPSWEAWSDEITPAEYVYERLDDAGFPDLDDVYAELFGDPS